MLTDDQKLWLICRKIRESMPPPSGSFTYYTGDERGFAHKPVFSHWKEGFIVLGRSAHLVRADLDYYRVRWWTSNVEFDISVFDLSHRGVVETFILTVLVAPFFLLWNFIKHREAVR